jgi:PAS domain S-box-containing protein
MPQSLIDLAGLRVGAEEFLSAVLAATEQPIWVVDRDDVIRFANPAAIAGLGYARTEELLGRHSHETIHHSRPDGKPFPVEDCPMLLPRVTGETVSSELDWFFRRDGSMFPVSYVSAPIELHDGRGAVVAFTDIEDRLRAEQALREHEAAIAAQQSSLRRVATLVAGGAASHEVFAAIAREVGQVIGLPLVAVWRYEPDGSTATVVGVWSEHPHPFRPGSRWPLDGPTITARVLKTGRSVRIDDWADVPGTIADAAREVGITGAAGAPIIVDGDIWGAMSADSTARAPMPEDVEERLLEFTELIGAVFATTARQDELARLAEEQAALRRVATLVARGAPPGEIFEAVIGEIGRLLSADAATLGRYENHDTLTVIGFWGSSGQGEIPIGGRHAIERGNLAQLVRDRGVPARVDSYAESSGGLGELARGLGWRSAVGAPMVVEGRVWGVVAVASTTERVLPAETEKRLAAFAELLATAIANAQSREDLTRLADSQAALRRVATLVAEDVPASELFGAVVQEVGRLFGSDLAGMIHYELDDTVIATTTWAAEGDHPPVEGRWSLEGDRLATVIARTGRPAREDDWSKAEGPIAEFIRGQLGVVSSVGSPIVVEGRVWGALFVHSKEEAKRLPAGTESRLLDFTELIATAVSNAEARAEIERLAAEQTALRRVATLVAQEPPPAEVFGKVAEEMATVLGDAECALWRDEGDGTAAAVALWGRGISAAFRLGERLPIDGHSLTAVVIREGRPHRLDDIGEASGAVAKRGRAIGLRAAVAFPIVVRGRTWGALGAGRYTAEPFPPGTEARIARFAELVATAVANAEARAEVERLAEEQAALRRIAMLVACEASDGDVFGTVTEEAARVLGTEAVALLRFEPDDTATLVAQSHTPWDPPPLGTRFPLDGENLVVSLHRTGEAVRVDS